MRIRTVVAICVFCGLAAGQSVGTISGKVTLAATGDPLHHATVLLVQLGKSAESGNDGAYSFTNLPPGAYTLVAHMHALSDERRSATVTAGWRTTAIHRVVVFPRGRSQASPEAPV